MMSDRTARIGGDWEIAFAGDRTKSAICTLIQTDNEFTGIFHAPLGELPIEGALNNDGDIVFTAESIIGIFNFFGMINGGNMYGIVDFPKGKCLGKWTAIKIVDE
jgi:hypothetical protein